VKQAETMTTSLTTYAAKLNQKGGLANDIVTDTLIMRKIRLTITELNETALTARAMVSGLKKTTEEVTSNITNNRKSPVGVLLHDEATAANLKSTIQNLETSTDKLDENMEALQSNFLFRRYFRKQAKAQKDSITIDKPSIN
jgi:phospholipid/cholesterol/gamma-HCH transport system substrate-binding protein